MTEAVGGNPENLPGGETPPESFSVERLIQATVPPELRRASRLPEDDESSHSAAETTSLLKNLADRLRALLGTNLVSIFLRQTENFSLSTVAVGSDAYEDRARAGYDRKGLAFAADLASRALLAGEPITAAIDPLTHNPGDLVPAGALVAAPFRTSRTEGAVLVYPRTIAAFTDDEKKLISAITTLAAVSISNAELCATARSQTHELHELMDIGTELSGAGTVEEFMKKLGTRVAEFLNFSRVCIGTVESGVFRIEWELSQGSFREIELGLPRGTLTQKLSTNEPVWFDENKTFAGSFEVPSALRAKQTLMVPVAGRDGQVIGLLALLDRGDGENLSEEDVRRAKLLATQIATLFRNALSLQPAGDQSHRTTALIELALELNSLVGLPNVAKGCVTFASAILDAKAGALAIKQPSGLETTVLQSLGETNENHSALWRRFGYALGEALGKNSDAVVSSTGEELLGAELAKQLGWGDCILVRLIEPSGALLAVLCLANRGKALLPADEQLLHSIAKHTSAALLHAQLFTRMERANRHWIEIFDAIGDFIVAHDGADNIMRVNRSLADFIGVPPRELIGVNMCAMLALDSAAPLRNCPFCRSSGEVQDEYVHPVLGSTFLVSTSRVHSDSSEGMQTIHVLKDITDRREAERRYRELFGNIQEGLFFATPEGAFIEVNDALVRMLAYESREELLQVDARVQVYGSAERYQQFTDSMREDGIVRNHEEALRRKDGSTVHVLINAFAVRDPQGKITQYRGLMLDITDLKAYQSELQRERDFSGKILNNTQSLILVTDTTGLVSYANRRWRDMGYEQQQVLGAALEKLVAPARRQAFRDAFSAILNGQQVDNLDLQVLRGDGRVGQFSVNLSPMRDEQGSVTSIVVVMSDITDAATLQAKLMHAEKMAAVGQLVSGVAHEVNNPLTAILGFADLLMENTELPESARKDMRVILQEAQRTKQIVQNLLSFARQMPPQRRPVEVNSILRRTVQLRAYDFQSHGIQVVEELDQALPLVIGDSHQLQQVFLNIVNNAYDAVRETGRPARIEVKTSSHNGVVEAMFRDNGHGITFPERIFDPFFTTKEVGKGTGLGLSICYGIVREHGGEILCHNNIGIEGATFIVRFPAAPEGASVGAAAGTQPR